MKKLLPFLLLVPLTAQAQNAVTQVGPVTKYDVAGWIADHQIETGTTMFNANKRGLNPFHTFDNKGEGSCWEDALTSGPYHQFCLGHDSGGNAVFKVGSENLAGQGNLIFNINGKDYTFPFIPTEGPVTGITPTVPGHLACWNDTNATSLKDCTSVVNTYATGVQFWGGPTNNQYRFQGRTFLGAAVQDGGTNIPFPAADWLSQTISASYNGGSGTGATCAYAQVCVLGDISSASPSPPNPTAAGMGGVATPHQALAVANSSKNAWTISPSSYSTPRTLDVYFINDTTNAPLGGGPKVPGWAMYIEAHRVGTQAGQTFGIELEVRNSTGSVTGWTPYATAGDGTIGIELGVGVGGPVTPTGQFPATTGMYFWNNGQQWASGILFTQNSIGAFGVSGSKPAIMQPFDYEYQWFKSNGSVAARLFSNDNGDLIASVSSGASLVSSQNITIGDSNVIYFGTGHNAYLAGTSNNLNIIAEVAGVEYWRADGISHYVDITGVPLALHGTAAIASDAVNLCMNVASRLVYYGNGGSSCYSGATKYAGSLGADVGLTNTGQYFIGPKVSQGSTGVWWASGNVTLLDVNGAATFNGVLRAGSTIVDSGTCTTASALFACSMTLSGFFTSPPGDIHIAVNDGTSVGGAIKWSYSGQGRDSTVSVMRIQ